MAKFQKYGAFLSLKITFIFCRQCNAAECGMSSGSLLGFFKSTFYGYMYL